VLRCVTLVRIETGDGAVGWGEAISQFPEASLATRTLVHDGFAPLILGEDPLDVARHWQACCSASPSSACSAGN
jgi:L-alanine-DL-glutamate epimerase-like enolase superfamily enzyme